MPLCVCVCVCVCISTFDIRLSEFTVGSRHNSYLNFNNYFEYQMLILIILQLNMKWPSSWTIDNPTPYIYIYI